MIESRHSNRESSESLLRTSGKVMLVFFLLVFSAAGIEAQNPPAPESPEGSVDRESLVAESLVRDISTASKDELAAWAAVLGLNTELSEAELRQSLSRFYSLDAAVPDTGTSSGARIVIESAGRSEYMNVEIVGGETESVVRLSGNVVVTVTEADRPRTHRVEADTVIFNQEKKAISAIGNIRYTVDTDGREEKFTGDSLTFEVTDWTGVIFRGTSERRQDVDGTEVDFFFRGESIKRAGKDILILEDGSISSHDSDNPDYSLKARKIWITGPGEWGLLGATLFVGHVPVLYLPFYWKSGSDLFFNPVIGTRTRLGYYIQTTSYFLGRKEADDGFSIMGFGDSASEDYSLERDGLFLVRSQADGADAEKSTLKYMLDIYTSMGAMTGFLGSFPEVGRVGSLDFYATIGVSRSVDERGSPYFNDGSGTEVYWNSSYLGGSVIPFRWGSSFQTSLGDWTLHLDWYSDPYYLQDFDNRAENFDWLSFLLSEQETDEGEPDLVTEMTWKISGSHRFDVSGASPWLQSLALESFRTSLTWRNKSNSDIVGSSSPDRSWDPARNFFYPDQLVLPDLKFSLRGKLPAWNLDRLDEPEDDETADEPVSERSESESRSGRSDPDSASEEIAGTGSRPSGGEGGLPDDQKMQDSGRSGEVGDLESVEYLESFTAVYSTGLLDADLSYDLSSQLYIEDRTLSDGWTAPSDIDFAFEAARINTTHKSGLDYGISFWDKLTGVTGSTDFSGFYQVHADLFGDNAAISDTTRLEDYQYSQFLWDSRISVYLNPFQGIPVFSDSELKYSFDGNIFAYRFDEAASVAVPGYSVNWISGADDIRRHEASADLVWKQWGLTANTSIKSNVPPLDERHVLSAGLKYSRAGFTAGVSQQSGFQDSRWSVQPVIMNASWKGWNDEVLIRQSARYDGGGRRWSSAESTFRFWGFETRFVADYGTSYTWDQANFVWNEGAEYFSPSTLRFSYARDLNPNPFWRNRIGWQTTLTTSWNINLRQPTDNILTFRWTQVLSIYKFLDLSFSISSTNKAMYLYFEGWRDRLGINEDFNFFGDLARSFNFFNAQDRRDSQFNMDKIDVDLVHHLRNWDFSLGYSGWPALDSVSGVYRWKSELNVYMKWNPLPMFNQRTRFENDKWSVDSFESES